MNSLNNSARGTPVKENFMNEPEKARKIPTETSEPSSAELNRRIKENMSSREPNYPKSVFNTINSEVEYHLLLYLRGYRFWI